MSFPRKGFPCNGMDENTTFHAVNRELACAALDQHDGNYARKKVNAQAYCAAYVIGKHMERNFGEQEQTFSQDAFSFEEPPKQTPKKEKKEKQPER